MDITEQTVLERIQSAIDCLSNDDLADLYNRLKLDDLPEISGDDIIYMDKE